ncbi:hypothetical protein LWI29_012656 [Acer saccharum]|uniref:Uncharacterized protein n=1 Tax=Acer saccharum TaxID=4024 RepID=A0AA39VDE9_ACESA|nr:hypothetical protein LWI29_012656 [Acer saccharum]
MCSGWFRFAIVCGSNVWNSKRGGLPLLFRLLLPPFCRSTEQGFHTLAFEKDFTVQYTTTLGAPYGHHWRKLRRFIALEIFSAKRLQMSSEIHAEEVKFMIKHLYKRSLEGVWKVDVKSFFSMLDFNIMMKMVA